MGTFNDSGSKRFSGTGKMRLFSIAIPKQPGSEEDTAVTVTIDRHDKGPPLVIASSKYSQADAEILVAVVYREMVNGHRGKEARDADPPKGADFTVSWHVHGSY